MKKSRNEIRERNGRLIFACSFLLIFILLATSLLLSPTPVKPFEEDFSKKIKEQPLAEADPVYPIFLTNKRRNRTQYVGSLRKNDVHYVNGIQIQGIDSVSFSYSAEWMEDWKKVKEIEGIAQLEEYSLFSDSITVARNDSKSFPAYVFIDKEKECPVTIILSKNNYIGNMTENCNGQTKVLSPLMFEK